MEPVRRGSSFMLVACGLLAGLLIANLTGGGSGRATQTATAAGNGGSSGLQARSAGGSAGSAADASVAGGAATDGASGSPTDAGGASTGTGSASGAGPSSASGPGGTGAAAGGATDVGVTAKAVKLGISAIDTRSLKALGPSYDTGDSSATWRAIIDEARADGRLPVNGRDIDPYIVAADVDVTPNAPANRRSECLQMVEDAKVFAVVAGNQIDTDCVAKEHKVPLITSLLPGHDSDPQQVPMLFSTQTNFEKGLRNTAAWLIEAGVLKGHKLGLYYADDDTNTYRPMLQANFIPKIEAAGFKIVKEVKWTQADAGRESTQVLQFQSAGVDMILDFNAINLVSGPSFLNAAQSADYHPKYVELGVSSGSTFEGVSDNYNADQWDGTLALLDDARSLEFGPQGRAGLSPATQKCADTIKRRRGQEIDPVKTSAAWQLYNQSCDLLNIVIEALKIAGPNLTRASFVAALEKVQLGPPLLGWWPSGGFGREHNWGRQVRVARYDKDCSDKGRKVCWRPQGGYRPYWVP